MRTREPHTRWSGPTGRVLVSEWGGEGPRPGPQGWVSTDMPVTAGDGARLSRSLARAPWGNAATQTGGRADGRTDGWTAAGPRESQLWGLPWARDSRGRAAQCGVCTAGGVRGNWEAARGHRGHWEGTEDQGPGDSLGAELGRGLTHSVTGEWAGGRSRGPSVPPAASARPQMALGTPRLQPQDPEAEARLGGRGLTLTRWEGPWARPAAHTRTRTPGGVHRLNVQGHGAFQRHKQGPRSPPRASHTADGTGERSSVGRAQTRVLSSLPGAGGLGR